MLGEMTGKGLGFTAIVDADGNLLSVRVAYMDGGGTEVLTVVCDTSSEAAVQALAAAYGNIGYMGPGLTIAALGPHAVVPTALIFVFDNMQHL